MVAYRNCPRYRFLKYHYRGTGVERKETSLPLVTGIALHEAIARILRGDGPEAAFREAWAEYEKEVVSRGIYSVSDLTENFVREQEFLLRGLIYAWARVRLPIILFEYEPVLIEREILWEMGRIGLVQVLDMVRCDALLRRRSDSMLFYVEFKSTSKSGEEWIKQWEHNSQLLINTVAVEETLGERLGGVLIEGLVKGRRSKCGLRTSRFCGEVIQDSPLCYAWRDANGTLHSEWTRNAEHVRLWEAAPDDPFSHLTDEDLSGLFVPVPPIRPNNAALARHRRQALYQEVGIARALADLQANPQDGVVLDVDFPLNDDHCQRYWGNSCEMERLCFDRATAADPLGSGLYQRRRPHHEAEIHAASRTNSNDSRSGARPDGRRE